jgi:HemY protein
MLWSLIKILLFVVSVGALTLGAEYLLESEGGIQLTVAGTEYTLGPLQSVLAAIVLVIVVWLLLKLLSLLVAVWRFLNGDETAISRYFDRNRERKGFQALSEGMMALASGEGRLAMAKAAKAEKYLQKPELTNLLTAQAAELSGDRKKAEETYKKLIASDTTRFVGVRGIMKQRLSEGDTETARKLAEKAFQLKPKHEETQDVLLTLQAQANDWAGARTTLSAKL